MGKRERGAGTVLSLGSSTTGGALRRICWWSTGDHQKRSRSRTAISEQPRHRRRRHRRMLLRRVIVPPANLCRIKMFEVVLEDVPHGVAHLRRRPQHMGVVAVGQPLAALLHHAIEGASDADAEAL